MRTIRNLLAPVGKWAWLPAAVLLLWSVPWGLAVYRDFVRFGIERDIDPFLVRLGELARSTLHADLRRMGGLGCELRREPSAGPSLRTVQLVVAPEDLASLVEDLPYSGRVDVPGGVLVAGIVVAADVRLRGDTFPHWGRAKKSLRVRMRDKHDFEGMRVFNLCAPKYPEQLNNHLGYRLARSLGLLAPRSEMVELCVNGKRRGLHLLVEQPGAQLVQAAGRTPGALCVGELLARDAWSGVPRELFTNAALWDVEELAVDNAGVARDALARLLANVQAPASERTLRELESLLDLDRFARLSVFEMITQTHHFDHFHNWRLHWDPQRRHFEPVVWDPVGWQEAMRPSGDLPIDLHPAFTALHARLHAHAGFLVARDRCLSRWFAEGGDRQLLAELDDSVRATAGAIVGDPDLWPPDPDVVIAAQAAFAAAVRGNLEELRTTWIALLPRGSWAVDASGAGSLRLQVDGPRPLADLELRFRDPIEPSRVELCVVRADGHRDAFDLGGRWRGDGPRLVLQIALPAALTPVFAWRTGSYPLRNHRLATTPTDYEIVVHGVDMQALVEVRDGAGQTLPQRRLPPWLPTRELFRLDHDGR